MRIVLDGVFNHASRGFFQFNHILENGPASPYLDWFTANSFPLRPYHAPQGEQGYEAWWDLPALPKFNTSTPAVRQFLWDVATYWIEQGADGWRLDVPAEIDDDEFWREFRSRVKAINPEAYLVGEVWGDARRWLQGDQFDAVMNYLFTGACLGFFVGDDLLHEEIARTGYHRIEPLDAEGFASEIGRLLAPYPGGVTEVQFNLLGSHDTPRFKTLARDDDSAYRLATLFQMTYPGAPSIYYGDEIGMVGSHDPGCRGAFPWDANDWNSDLLEHVRRSVALRKAHPALRRGDFNWLLADNGVVAFGRKLDQEALIVILNSGRQGVTVDIPVSAYLEEGAQLRGVWHHHEALVERGHIEGIHLPPRSGIVLETVRVVDP
jgi:neopullulanase